MKSFGMKNSFKMFEGFKQFEMFDNSGWFSGNFGSFTFEMAEQVFEKAFKNMDR